MLTFAKPIATNNIKEFKNYEYNKILQRLRPDVCSRNGLDVDIV